MRAIGKFLAILTFLPALPCSAQQAPESMEPRASFFTLENDFWSQTDYHYTSGLQFSSRSMRDTRGRLTRSLTDGACRLFGCGDARFLFTQHNLGQLMYTPGHITVAAPQPFDRPWAGLLYTERQWLFLAADGEAITTLAAQAGLTGRLSLVEQTQKFFHRVFDDRAPRGWHNQIGNTLAVLVSAERHSAWPLLSGDLAGNVGLQTASHWRLAAGSIMSYAAGGVSVTIGKNLPSVALMPPGIVNRRALADTGCMFRWLQCTLVLGAEARRVGWNLFLQGRPWKDDPSVEPRRWVGELSAGLRLDFPGTRGLDHGPLFVQLRLIRRSAEFHSPLHVPVHTIGSLTLGTDL